MGVRAKSWFVAMWLGAALLNQGCALFLVGAGAAGGYAIGKDEMEGFTDKRFDKAWDVTKKVISREGVVLAENQALGDLQARIRESEVTAKVERISEKTVRIRIKARKGYKLMPDIKLAQDLFTKTFKELA